MIQRCKISIFKLAFIVLAAVIAVQAAPEPEVDTVLTDEQFFDALDLSREGLSQVKKAVDAGDNAAAISELAAYYRARPLKGHWWKKSYEPLDEDTGRNSYERTFINYFEKNPPYGKEKWNDEGRYNWGTADGREMRMYSFSNIGEAWRYSKDERVIAVFNNLFKSWIEQYPNTGQKNAPGWTTMPVGIRLRSGWGDAFAAISKSPQWRDEDMFLYLKSFYEQAHYLRYNHSETSNWLTFELAGLYSAGVLLPEFKEAPDWRDHAISTAVHDIERGWLPDGVSVELSLGYGQFFSNFLHMSALAAEAGINDRLTQRLTEDCERLFTPYLQLMTPDRRTPAINDNRPVNVPEFLAQAAEKYPQRKDFLWASTGGKRGTKPDYLSVAFPYAGLLAIRSGWERDDNFLCFIAGPVGYRHAHQDKLSIVLNAYGREIIYDPGASAYSGGKKNQLYEQYIYDTFAHSTALVDDRPQRRKWYNDPHPNSMPYKEAPEFEYQIAGERVWGRGFYNEHYGRAGSKGTDAYPYKDGGNFKEGWTRPATHERQVFYIEPDIFIVQDILEPLDGSSHTYDVRWQIDSVNTQLNDEIFFTNDPAMPNLLVLALDVEGLETQAISAQNEPDVMGWKVADPDNPQPATTLRHIKEGKGTKQFLTLLLPLKKNQECPNIEVQEAGRGVTVVRLDGKRTINIMPASRSNKRLRAAER